MVKAVVGANWGDEGKGKITDMLAEQADIIVRFQGGANAGHTIINDYGKFALHTLPSGVFYGHTTSIIGNGVALDVPVLFKEEVQKVEEDFQNTLAKCHKVTVTEVRNRGVLMKVAGQVLRLVAPLM